MADIITSDWTDMVFAGAVLGTVTIRDLQKNKTSNALCNKCLFFRFSIAPLFLASVVNTRRDGGRFFATVGYSSSLDRAKRNRILVCGVAILYIAFCLFNGSHLDMVKCAFPFGPVDFIGAVCCVMTILMVSKRFQNNLMSTLLPAIGRNSIWILCIHTIEFDIFPWWGIERICTIIKIDALYKPIQIILRIVMAICISIIAEKMRNMNFITTNLKKS